MLMEIENLEMSTDCFSLYISIVSATIGFMIQWMSYRVLVSKEQKFDGLMIIRRVI